MQKTHKKIKLCKCGARRFTSFSKCGRCRADEAKAKKLKKLEKHKTTKAFQKREHRSLKSKAWKVFSEYIRRKDANSDGMTYCYTCSKALRWQDAHCGHFMHGKLDFDERNLKPQCPGCNTYKHGNLAIYGVKLAKELGVEGMEQLMLDANTKVYSKDDLEQVITTYTNLIKSL